MNVLEQMLSNYEIKTEYDAINALKEIFQEIALLGLYRGGFFNKAAFYGGTALRILYGLDRFSEDLDFSLLQKDKNFSLDPYLGFIKDEFEALGINIFIESKQKSHQNSHIESAFFKNNTSLHSLQLSTDKINNVLGGIYKGKKIKIKLEVDTYPPLNFQTETKTLLMPITFNVLSLSLPNLYAGKIHALLFRKWKNRVKGRDWYDFEWYVKRNTKLNLNHLQVRIQESEGFNTSYQLDPATFINLMHERIDQLNVKNAISEVSPFLRDTSGLQYWSKEYFKHLTEKILFQ